MSHATTNSIRSIELDVPDIEVSRAFYEDAWGLSESHRSGNSIYMRGTGPEHHIVALHPTNGAPGVRRIVLGAADRQTTDTLSEQVASHGGTLLSQPGAIDAPGQGYGFSFRDLEGREFAVISDREAHADASHVEDRPFKLTHVVLNAVDTDGSTDWYNRALGIELREQTKMMNFIGCNSDHHILGFTRFDSVSLHHISFEIPSWDGLMHGCGRLKRSGFDLQWGVGRHGPGHSIFAYFLDPHDIPIEYAAEMEQIDENFKPRTIEQWGLRGAQPDVWGFANPPSERFGRATHSVHA
jgi:catechol-2,3-dioxygenase